MGKKGDLLRQQKKQNRGVWMTMEQLAEHDRKLLEEHREIHSMRARQLADERYKENMKGAIKVIDDEWRLRQEQFQAASPEDRFLNWEQYLLCVAGRVLVEKFGWRPLVGDYDNRRQLARFLTYVQEEINEICSSENLDIRAYAQECKDKYGIEFIIEEEE